MNRITFGFIETTNDGSYGEVVVRIKRDDIEIGRVVVFVGSGKNTSGHTFFSVDVKPTDWRNWIARLFGFHGEQKAGENEGRPYMTRRTGQVEHEGLLTYTVYAMPKEAR